MKRCGVLHLRQILSTMRLRQFIPGLFCRWRAEKPKRNSRRKSHRYTARKMCACSTRHRSPDGSLILPRGQLRPPLHPPDQDLRPLDPTRSASPSGLPTGRRFTLRPPDRCFGSGLDQESLRALHGPPDRGRLRSPPDPHRPAVRRLDPRQGFRAHGPRAGSVPAPAPPANPGRIGCALPHATAWGYSLPVPCDAERYVNLKIHAGVKQP